MTWQIGACFDAEIPELELDKPQWCIISDTEVLESGLTHGEATARLRQKYAQGRTAFTATIVSEQAAKNFMTAKE